MANTTPKVSAANAPFNIPTADVVFRTSDNVDFRLAKLILCVASPFFDSMFSLTQPPDATTSNSIDPIQVPEDSKTFDCLMRYVYPVDDPQITDLNLMERVLRAAIKYELAEANKLIFHAMRTQVSDTQPFEVYAVACLLGIEDEAVYAAKKCAAAVRGRCKDAPCKDFKDTLEGISFTPRMHQVSAGAYYRLVKYLRNPEVPVELVERFIDGKSASLNLGLVPALKSTTTHGAIEKVDSGGERAQHKNQLYADNTNDADTTLLSSDRVAFPVHSLVLRLVSADKLLGGTPDSNGHIATHLDSAMLSLLLSFCYPLRPFDFTDFSSVMKVYHAATQLQIQPVISAIRLRFNSLISSCPNLMSMYLVAAEQGWMEEAQEAAKLIASRGKERMYALEMDNASVSALAYYRLLKFCYQYNQATVSVIEELAPDIESNLHDRYKGIQLWMASVPLPVVEQLQNEDIQVAPLQWLDEGTTFREYMKDALLHIQLETGPVLDKNQRAVKGKPSKRGRK